MDAGAKKPFLDISGTIPPNVGEGEGKGGAVAGDVSLVSFDPVDRLSQHPEIEPKFVFPSPGTGRTKAVAAIAAELYGDPPTISARDLALGAVSLSEVGKIPVAPPAEELERYADQMARVDEERVRIGTRRFDPAAVFGAGTARAQLAAAVASFFNTETPEGLIERNEWEPKYVFGSSSAGKTQAVRALMEAMEAGPVFVGDIDPRGYEGVSGNELNIPSDRTVMFFDEFDAAGTVAPGVFEAVVPPIPLTEAAVDVDHLARVLSKAGKKEG